VFAVFFGVVAVERAIAQVEAMPDQSAHVTVTASEERTALNRATGTLVSTVRASSALVRTRGGTA
jgi:hypothetical protein